MTTDVVHPAALNTISVYFFSDYDAFERVSSIDLMKDSFFFKFFVLNHDKPTENVWIIVFLVEKSPKPSRNRDKPTENVWIIVFLVEKNPKPSRNRDKPTENTYANEL